MLNQQLKYLQNLERFEQIKPGLTNMHKLLTALGNPHTSFPSIHIAGTNGKGSTAIFINGILNQTKLKVGLYTSPHLRSFNERVVINNQPITNSALTSLIDRVKKAAAKANISPTFFEFTTAIAFLHFSQSRVDIAIIEVGMGGKLDATNVINPILTIITNIDLDHTQWLGQTKAAIAARKAGIIKPHTPLITAETDTKLLAYLARTCQSKHAPIYPLHQHLITSNTDKSLTKQDFSTTGLINDAFSISLLGDHQITNAATALLAINYLNQKHPQTYHVTPTQIKRGLSSAQWDGRCHIVSRHPFTLLDGAHNDASLNALSTTLDSYPFPKPDVLVLGLKQDKDPSILIDKIIPRFRHVIITEANYQPMASNKLATLLTTSAPHTKLDVIPHLKQAITTGQKSLRPNSMLLITGSLYLVGDALSILHQRKTPLNRGDQI